MHIKSVCQSVLTNSQSRLEKEDASEKDLEMHKSLENEESPEEQRTHLQGDLVVI